MAKKNDDLIRVLTLLPWWVNLSLAPLAYLLASRAAPAMLADNAFAPVFGPVFTYLGIALAAFFVVAAVGSFVGSIRKRRLLDRQTSLDSIRALSWRQFEELVAEAFRRDGYRAIENDQPGPDGGVDIRLHRDGARHLVQCKNWRSRRVGVRVVREVYGVLTAENAQHAFIVSSGDFTADARGFAAGQPITLVDGDALHAMVQGARRPDGNDHHSADMVPPDTSPDSAPLCPQCGGRLVVRTARQGEFAGQRFLGCATYPGCRYTRNLADA